ncbi:methyltransferase domain-containing protein [Aquabacter sp. CN5-332]|uniref:methyltransferase domain-containing protein n=1 Tax=Aquabacter sp. CN5-332 TaxID=3156608 RepID=UPI0032B3A1FA
MRRLHFETLKPVCPACRLRRREAPLELAPGAMMQDDAAWTGVLRCTAQDCAQAYPIIAGTPILVPDLPSWLSANLHLVLESEVEGTDAEAVIGAAVGPDAAFNVARQQQSTYGHDHYGDLFEPVPVGSDAEAAGSIRRLLAAVRALLKPADGPVLDIGCAVGRTTLDLAAGASAPVLGIDLNWQLLKIARRAIDQGVVSYPLRRVGNRFERRSVRASFPGANHADFWIADALALPFRSGTFRQAFAMNVLDCVADPAGLVCEMSRALSGEGELALATPFDWASHATNPSGWLESPVALESMLAGIKDALAGEGGRRLVSIAPPAEQPWHVRLHDRAAVHYTSQLLTFRCSVDPGEIAQET